LGFTAGGKAVGAPGQFKACIIVNYYFIQGKRRFL